MEKSLVSTLSLEGQLGAEWSSTYCSVYLSLSLSHRHIKYRFLGFKEFHSHNKNHFCNHIIAFRKPFTVTLSTLRLLSSLPSTLIWVLILHPVCCLHSKFTSNSRNWIKIQESLSTPLCILCPDVSGRTLTHPSPIVSLLHLSDSRSVEKTPLFLST